MEPQKEIGDLIREKVDVAQEKLEGPVWERIKETLAQQKRKRMFYNWSLNGLIILFSAIGFYAITTNLSPPKKTDTKTNTSSSLQEKDATRAKNNETVMVSPNPNIQTKVEKASPTPAKETHAEEAREANRTVSYLKNKEVTPSETQVNVKETNQNPAEAYIAERTEKVYYYYNSKDGQEVMTTDVKIIDSITKVNYARQDSLR